MGWRVAVDIGGAFTDLLAINNNTKEQYQIIILSKDTNEKIYIYTYIYKCIYQTHTYIK